MKIIDEKQFLDALSESDEMTGLGMEEVIRVLSKHLKDLPKKKEGKDVYSGPHADGYNQCLEDCEVK